MISAVKSTEIETELLRLSTLSSEELRNLGYDSAQIEILHSYEGEPIETNLALRGVFADLTCTPACNAASGDSITAKVSWNWSNPPLLSGTSITDVVAIRWKGTNSQGNTANFALDKDASSCKIYYYSRVNNVKKETVSKALTTDDAYEHAERTFKISSTSSDANGTYYAKKGAMIVKIERTGSLKISEAAYYFSYGHPTVTVTPTVSYPTAFQINFNSSTEKMCTTTFRINKNGKVTEYE